MAPPSRRNRQAFTLVAVALQLLLLAAQQSQVCNAFATTTTSRAFSNNVRITQFASSDDDDGVAPLKNEGVEEMTEVSDEFVKQIDESIREEMGVGLDELLNPAKVSVFIV